ncbi:MAG: hypothetical protein ACTSVV_06300 [Promethearchaeota archaeon]
MDKEEIMERLLEIREVVRNSIMQYNFDLTVYLDVILEEVDKLICDLSEKDDD